MIDVPPEILQIILSILNQKAPECEVRAFGSRVHGSPKKHSDLDLALIGKEKLSDKTLCSLKEAFEESDIPFRVDFLDWNTISKEFQSVINREHVVLQTGAVR